MPVQSINEIRKKFSEIFGADALFGCLFGSVLEARFNDESNIDIAVYFCDGVDASQISLLREKLADALDRDVDCIDLRSADPIITMQVIQNGQLAFPQEADLYHQFVARKISEYIDFKKSRELVEKNLVGKRIIGVKE